MEKITHVSDSINIKTNRHMSELENEYLTNRLLG